MSKTKQRRAKYARIQAAQERDSLSIAKGQLQKQPFMPKGITKSNGRAIVRAIHNSAYAPTGGDRMFSQSQGGYAKMPSWYKNKH